ncbi:GNAT family N-acetyltransferase [Zhouia amylolytica]|uniref:N-acetyltransferase GCN5 n=1 Tax=Zhouia amylolytica AD3 TaxID=1286632 RepID=W2UM19_9FLAO|nr:GNAT family N-acetyltransferase [Zhouia amylolytica]ETN94496.1 N-acetyltransferase GCN5 [Zhouia amylolytica AD3]MCQ0110276.1 GNAT family N-acetyltransferase [Zhouia amylolytica]
MLSFILYNTNNKPDEKTKSVIVDFLFNNLEQYGDPKEDILKCLNYAVMDEVTAHGGFALVAKDHGKIVGITIINETGMSGYIPENILVYIAVATTARGKGVGKAVMEKAISLIEGGLALHVEPDNPAKILYEKLGFTNKYLEMRLTK